MRVRKLIGVVAAFLLFAGLALVAVTLPGSSKAPVPVQQTGTAAGRPHKVSAAADIGRVVNGKFVPRASSPARGVAGPVAKSAGATPGAVVATAKAKPVKLPARGKTAPETATPLAESAPVKKAGYNAKTSKELVPSSADQITYSNMDGTKTAFEFQNPVNYKKPDGSWATISTALVPARRAGATQPSASVSPSGTQVSPEAYLETPEPSPSGTPSPLVSSSASPSGSAGTVPSASPSPASSPSAPGASSPPPSAPAPSSAPAGGWTEKSEAAPESFAARADAADLVRMPVGSGGQSVGFGIEGAAAVTGTASGSTVTYAGVRTDSSAEFSGGTGAVKETLVLSSPSAPDTWVFPLDLTGGLKARIGPGGIVEFVNPAGQEVAYVPQGFMTDSKINPHSGNGATSFGVTYSLVTVNGGQAVKMSLDKSWLDSQDRVYPVQVDPSVQTAQSGGTTYTLTPYDNDYSGDTQIDVGTYDGGANVAKSYLDFSGIASSLQNDTVLGAELGVFNTWSYSCSARPVYVYPVTSSWSVTGDKSSGPSTGAAVGSKSFATGWVPEGSSSSPCPSKWEGIGLNQAGTKLVNGWTHGTTADDGLALGASGSDSYGWKQFASDSYPDSNADPFLAVTYSTDGASYKLASRTPVTQATPDQAGVLKVTVKNTGSSTWTSSNGYKMTSEAYSSSGKVVSGSLVYTAMPSTVAPGQSVTMNVSLAKLGAGSYRIVLGMYNGSTSFLSQAGIPALPVGLTVPELPPTVADVYPPNGFTASTLRQQLSTSATGTGTLAYDFTLTCEPLAGQTCIDSSVSSGSISTPYWTPPAADLDWGIPYEWSVKVTATSNGESATTTVGPVDIEAEVPQPAITADLGGSSGQAYDPLSGNYTTSATDAAVKSVGPALEIDRVYNSMDPRTSGAFGAGWSTVADTSLVSENSGATVLVTLPDGQQLRFGENGDGSYAAPEGSPDALVESSSGSWTLRDSSGNRYAFSSAGQLQSITDVNGYAQDFAYDATSGELTTITDTISGRSLSLTWSTPSGATSPHVASVSTPAPASGDAAYTWTYSYTGDELTQACAPATAGTGCTSYTYGSGSLYRTSVLDSDPRAYWQLGDDVTTGPVTDEVDANLGQDDGTVHETTPGGPSPLAGSDEPSTEFDNSWVGLPNNLVEDSTDVSVGLWFKDASSTTGGVLFGYAADPLGSADANSANHDPALYVGANGELYGEFWNGASANAIHTSTSVEDGNWHYAVLTANSNSQSLYLDGSLVGTSSGQINQLNMAYETVGAGSWENWPEATQGGTATPNGYFDGDIGQVAVYAQPLTAQAIQAQYAAATTASSELTQVTLPSGKTYQSATYDTDTARLHDYTDPDGATWKLSEPSASGTKASSDSLGYAADSVTVSGPDNQQDTYEYDLTDGGRLISYDNDTPENTSSDAGYAGDPPTTYGYDAAGFLETIDDPDGNLVCLTNDIHGNVLARTWYNVQEAAQSGTGVPGPVTDPCAEASSGSENADCASSDPGPCTTYYSYYYNDANPLDPENDKLLSVSDGRSSSATDTTYETQYTYTSTGQLSTVTTPPTSSFPDGRITRYGYTEGTETAPDGGTEPKGLLSQVKTPGGAKTSYTYNSNGDLAQVTEPSGQYTAYTYDGLGRAMSSTVYTSTDTSGAETTYSYTPTGQDSVVTYPAVTNQVTNVTHQLVDTYSYDDDNDLLSLIQTDAVGGDASRTTSYTYNDHDEVATVTQPAGATSGGTAQTDGASSADPDGATTAYDYDPFGDISQATSPDGYQYRYSYNEYQEPDQETLYTPSQDADNSQATCTAPAVQDPDGGCDLVLESDAYDPAGLLASSTDAMGRITNYGYNPDQELNESSVTEACSTSAPCDSMGQCTPTAQCTTGSVGTSTTYAYDAVGNVISKTVAGTYGGADEASTTTDFTYDADNELTGEVNDATPANDDVGATTNQNRTTAYTYTADGYVASKTTGIGSSLDVTDYGYDTADDLTSQTVVNGSSDQETTWTYDQNGLPLSETSPLGNVSGATASDYTTNFSYDPVGDLVSETGPPVATSTYASQTPTTTRPVTDYGYDTFGDQTQVQDPDGNITTAAFDGDGRATSVEQAAYTPPGASAPITKPTTYSYDEDGNLVSETDPEGNTTSYTYDALGDVTSKTDPQLPGQSAAGTWDYTYDADGEQLSATDPLGNKSQETWDYFGNKATSTDALQNTTQYAYDYLGDQTAEVLPSGSATTSAYDGLGELTARTDGAGDKSTYEYDDQGNLEDAFNPDGSFTQYGYDEANQLTSETDYPATPAGEAAQPLRSESFGYDADGSKTSVDDWDGNTTHYTYNAAGELTSQVVPVSSSSSITTSYGYDAAGNRTSVTGGNQNQTWTTYNSWDLPESVVEPETATASTAADTTWTTAYNADGEPSSVTEPGGVSLAYGYDPLGDITSETGSGASASTPDRSFTYDLDGRMASAASGSQPADEFTYYPTGDLDTASGPSGTSSYDYDSDGLVSSETDAAGTTSYTYDDAGRLASETDPLTGATESYQYNADSNPTSVSWTNADGSAGPAETLGYDSLERLTSDTLTSSSGSVLASEAYGYDGDGNVTSQAAGGDLPGGSVTYAYDDADRLASATSGSSTVTYGYDGDGNLVTDGPVTNTFNAQDQLTSSADASTGGTTSYSYSLNGELSSATPSSGSAQDYTWDAYGDLASAGGVSYGYDALGRMDSRTGSSGTTASMSYLGTGDSLASDGSSDYAYDPSGEVTAEGSASGGSGSGDAVMTDRHGDVVGTFSTASGTSGLAGDASYSAFGAVTSSSGSMPGTGYQGDYTDPVTGLVYMNARWYDPANGSFVSSDTVNGAPVPSTVDGNPYAYADGNPVTGTDPSGHDDPGDDGDGDIDLWEGLYYYYEDGGDGGGEDSLAEGEAIFGPAFDEIRKEIAEEYFYDNDDSGDWSSEEASDAAEEEERADQREYDEEEHDLHEEHEEHEGHLADEGDDGGDGSYNGYDPYDSYDSYGGYDPYGGDGEGGEGDSGAGDGGAAEVTTPPPPPQDVYASGAESIPEAPRALTEDPYITTEPTVTERAVLTEKIPVSDEITDELTPTETNSKPVQGLTGTDSGSGAGQQAVQAETGSASDGDSLAGTPTSEAGKPGTPSAAGPEGGVSDSGADDAAQNSCPAEGGQSFTASTRVLLADGKTVPISSLKPGEKVRAVNTRTGKTEAETVTAVLVHHDTDLYDLTVKEQDGKTEVIDTTSSHLFWSPSDERWIPASQLKKGEQLRTADGTTATADGGSVPADPDGWMWDLTVPGDNDHDFYVLPADDSSPGDVSHYLVDETGVTPVLVHNNDRPDSCSLLFPGPNAHEGVPIENFGEMNASEVRAVQAEGDEYGCHSCGASVPRASGRWTLDHQPITSLTRDLGEPEQLGYPHCETCQNRQGNLASSFSTGRNPSGWRPNSLGLLVPKSSLGIGDQWTLSDSGLLYVRGSS